MTLYRNTKEVNEIYRKVDDIQKIFSDQRPFGFDEWGLSQNGTSPYWMKNLPGRMWNDNIYDNLVPYHYSFVSPTLKNSGHDVRNLMFSFDHGHLYCYATVKGQLYSDERLYLHIQKRPITILTSCSPSFSVIPPGKYVPLIAQPSSSYLRWHIRDSRFWAYYVRARNKFNTLLGKPAFSDQILFPSDDYYKGVFEKPFYKLNNPFRKP